MRPRTEACDVPMAGRTAEGRLLSAILRTGDLQTAIANGVTGDMFHHYKTESEWLAGYAAAHGRVPSEEAFTLQFPDFQVAQVDDVAHYAAEAKAEHRRQLRFAAVGRMYDHDEAGDAAKAEAELLRLAATLSQNGARGRVRSRLLADIQPESVNWLWPERVPLAAVTIVEGPPKTGKSTIATDLAARVSTGRAMPDDDGTDDPAGVIILSAEDHAARVIRPRLEAAGADLRRIRVVDGIDDLDDNGDAVVRPVALPDDIYRIEQVTRELGTQLVIVDPLMAYLSARVKGTVDQDVRRALLPLRELAERTNAAVLVIRHFRKSREGDPLNWGGGSIGIAGAARSILQVGKDPERADVRVSLPRLLTDRPVRRPRCRAGFGPCIAKATCAKAPNRRLNFQATIP